MRGFLEFLVTGPDPSGDRFAHGFRNLQALLLQVGLEIVPGRSQVRNQNRPPIGAYNVLQFRRANFEPSFIALRDYPRKEPHRWQPPKKPPSTAVSP
jgi:hypothetical protein